MFPYLRARALGVLSAAAALAAAGTVAASPAHAAGNTLTVNVSTVVRPVTHVAAGGLYGVDAGNKPPLARLLPLHLNNFTQPPPGTQNSPNGFGPCCDALSVAQELTDAGAQEYIRLPDIFPHFPQSQDWVSWSDWLSKVDAMVQARLDATSTTNISAYELWNEPDWTWPTAAAGSYDAGWTRTYNEVRSKDTLTPIVGPGWSHYDHNWMLGFLTNARDTKTLPDVIVWHELQDKDYLNVQAHVNDLRGIETSLGIGHRPISINEYGTTADMETPSSAIHYMAAFERAGIDNAERAFWHEPGTLDGLFWNGQPTASYWTYYWYGDQSGNVVQTVPGGSLDGVAAYDASRKRVNLAFGGDSGNNSVRVNGLGSLGSSVSVRLQRTNSTGRQVNEAAPITVSTATYGVVNGGITVPVDNMDAAMGYQLLITPATGAPTWQQRYEAENGTVVNANRDSSGNASNGGYVGQIDYSDTARHDSFVDFRVDVPASRTYTMTIAYANATGSNSTQGVAHNGGPWSTVTYPPTAAWGKPTGRVSVTLALNAGYNSIGLAKGSPFFAGGVGFAEIDFIQLS